MKTSLWASLLASLLLALAATSFAADTSSTPAANDKLAPGAPASPRRTGRPRSTS